MTTNSQNFNNTGIDVCLANLQLDTDLQTTDVLVLTFVDGASRQPTGAFASLNPSGDGDNYTSVPLTIANFKQSTGEISVTSPVMLPSGTLVQVTYQAG